VKGKRISICLKIIGITGTLTLANILAYPLSSYGQTPKELDNFYPTLESTDWQLSQSHDHSNHNSDHNSNHNSDHNSNHQRSHSEEHDWPEPIHDNHTYSLILLEQLEYRANEGEDSLNWDAIGWVGGDYERLWIKTEGEVGVENGNGEAELQLLYGQLITPYFDGQIGLRYQQLYGDTSQGRAFGVVGVQGMLPYMVETDAAIFISHKGDISAKLSAEKQLLLSQRLILEPKLETNLAIQDVEEFGVGSGINDLELGLRLRYEINRGFAPYAGINWTRKFGQTADFAKEEGEGVDNLAVVGGLRLMF
jgi:copper resistance protein B